ncbi:hypothetical protein CFC21_085328 [Triticum aestivum]|nr:hypothetical protein TRIUR3_18376 [Triticum urartu]KAF7081380.1 hypothetical protein CFC21_085328 [Triticum aestivum]
MTRRWTTGERWEKAEAGHVKASAIGAPDKRLCCGGAIMHDHHGKDIDVHRLVLEMGCIIQSLTYLKRDGFTHGFLIEEVKTMLRPLDDHKSARDWYLLQREHYDSVTRELKNYSREVVWTERLAKLLNVVYVLGTPFIVGPLVLKGIAIRRMCPLFRALVYVHWTAMCSANFAMCRAKLLAKSYGLRL